MYALCKETNTVYIARLYMDASITFERAYMTSHKRSAETLFCTVLYCTVLYCNVLYFTVLYCTVLYYTVLCCAVLYCAVLYCAVLYCTVLYTLLRAARAVTRSARRATPWHHTMAHRRVVAPRAAELVAPDAPRAVCAAHVLPSRWIALHCIALHCIALRCVALRCVALRCVALRCIALHYPTLRYLSLRYLSYPLPTMAVSLVSVLFALRRTCDRTVMPRRVMRCHRTRDQRFEDAAHHTHGMTPF